MGSILQHEVCDPRFEELEAAAYLDMHRPARDRALTRELNLAQAKIGALQSEIRLLKAAASRREDEYLVLLLQTSVAGLRSQKAVDSAEEQNAELRAVVRWLVMVFSAAVPYSRRSGWSRACWMCGAPGMCRHRERKLIPVWRGEQMTPAEIVARWMKSEVSHD